MIAAGSSGWTGLAGAPIGLLTVGGVPAGEDAGGGLSAAARPARKRKLGGSGSGGAGAGAGGDAGTSGGAGAGGDAGAGAGPGAGSGALTGGAL